MNWKKIKSVWSNIKIKIFKMPDLEIKMLVNDNDGYI